MKAPHIHTCMALHNLGAYLFKVVAKQPSAADKNSVIIRVQSSVRLIFVKDQRGMGTTG